MVHRGSEWRQRKEGTTAVFIIMNMNGLVKKLKRSTICTKGKRSANKKTHLQISRMDLCFADDSNDSGFDIDSRVQNSSNRNSASFDSFDPSSDDLDRDSSDDSIDSGIFVVSGSEELSSTDVIQRVDVGRTQHEDNGLANLLCHSISISEESQTKVTDSWSEESNEPPNKRLCIIPMSTICSEKETQSDRQNTDLTAQMNNSTEINLLGIASEAERLHLSPSRSGNTNVTSLTSNQMLVNRRKINRKQPALHITYPNRVKDGQIDLRILSQPEEQHRARYMTEGSRGAIKDRRGSAFPTVKLFGYNQPVTLQVFIGTDQGKIQPHLFYQACKVSGKNCTPCTEKVIDGTTVIEISMLPDKDMTVSCDCIGILKERNVDVEQRLPYFNMTRAKKKNTRCRMVFRVNLSLAEVGVDTLQVASSPILCTQPPGVPEISKKSIKECSVSGGTELFIIGKNFLKDTKIIFEEEIIDDDNVTTSLWHEVVEPEKEYLHQTHLVCRVPPYHNQNTSEPLKVHLTVQSGGKTSEPHTFIYLPLKQGLAADNLVGNYQNINSTVPGSIEFGRQMQRSHLMPAIIQVPGTMSATNIPTILMSQTAAGITFPEEINRDTISAKPDFSKLSTANSHRVSKNYTKGLGNQAENGKNSGQIHVLVVQQNERNNKRNHSISSVHGGRLRSGCFPGKRLNRFGHKGKFMAAARNKPATIQQQTSQMQTLPIDTQPLMGDHLILKQEMLCDASNAFSGNLMTEQITRIEPDQTVAATILSQSLPQPILSTVEQASDFQTQPLSSPVEGGVVGGCDQSMFSTTSMCEVDRIHSEIYPVQTILQVSPLPTEVLQSTQNDAMKVGVTQPTTCQTVLVQSNLVTNAGMQPMVDSGNLLALQQQPTLLQQNEMMQNDASLLAMQEATLKNSLLQTQIQCTQLLPDEVCANTVAGHLSPTECLPVTVQQLSNEELCSSLQQREMIDNQNKVLVCISPITESVPEENAVLSDNVQNYTQEALKCEVRSEEFLQQQLPCLSTTTLPVSELLQNSDVGPQLPMIGAKNELVNSILQSPLPQNSQQAAVSLAQYNAEVTRPQVQQSSLLQVLQQEQMIDVMRDGSNSDLRVVSSIVIDQHASPTAIDHIIQPMKPEVFLTQANDAVTLQQPNTTCISLSLNTLPVPITTATTAHMVVQPGQQNSTGAVPTGALDVKREKPTTDPHCDLMSTYQNSMTNVLSMLSENDLLSIINPSTFDNV